MAIFNHLNDGIEQNYMKKLLNEHLVKRLA